MPPSTAQWHPRRVLVTPLAALHHRWRKAGSGYRMLVVLAFLILQVCEPGTETLFGFDVPQALFKVVHHLLLASALLNLGFVRRDPIPVAVRRRWTSRADRYPVQIGLWQDDRLLGLDEGVVWFDGGCLRVEGLRFASAFDAGSARDAGLTVEVVRRASRPGAGQGWRLRLAPFTRSEFRPLRDAAAAWGEATEDAEWTLLPPREERPVEPWPARWGQVGPEAGIVIASYFFTIVGVATTSRSLMNVSLGVCLALLAVGVGLRVVAVRSARRADRAISGSLSWPSIGGAPETPSTEIAEPVYHRA